MQPIRLVIEDFCSHAKSEINFDDFTSAVIIGKGKKSLRSSNGVGKSTIFSAIKYALFNEIDFSTLDKTIRHGCDVCRVIFEFKINTSDIYRITRSRSKTSGSDIKLERKNNETWENITQRKPTENDREIIKIIKINYKTFCNSVLFSQTDLYGGGLAALRPADRKKALKEALQLNIYYTFEKLAKEKSKDIIKDIERSKTILSTLGNPQEDISNLDKQLLDIEQVLVDKNSLLTTVKEKLERENENFSQLNIKYELLEKQALDAAAKQKVLQDEVIKLSSSSNEYSKKLTTIHKDGKELADDISSLNDKLASMATVKIDIVKVKNNILKISENIVEKRASQKNVELRLNELSTPLPKDSVCKHCRQPITAEHRKVCQDDITNEIKALLVQKTNLAKKIDDLHKEELKLTNEKLTYEKNDVESIKIKQTLETKNKEVKSRRALYAEYAELADKIKLDLTAKNELLDILKKSQQNTDEYKELKEKILFLKNKIHSFNINIDDITKEISALSNNKAVSIHKKEKRNEDIVKINSIKEEILSFENKFSLHQKVVQAFGSGGIPALITHTILDDFQIDTNNFLAQLWPGLQAQFSVIKDRGDGDKDDTLDITYVLNGNELEYAQLSGAQKLIASLSLKLGLASVNKRRLGTDIKLLLIDEVDQSLDDDMLEAFEEAIKKLQKDFKILVITHNKELKEKFSHAILVEQDENLVSSAKLVNTW